MRPPICELCDARFSPKQGALISFKQIGTPPHGEAESLAVGHPENQGWFCPEHAEDAQAHVVLTLGEALQELRSPMAGPGATQRRLFDAVAQTQVVAIASLTDEGMQSSLIDVGKAIAPVYGSSLNYLGSQSRRRPMPPEPVYMGVEDYHFSTSTSSEGSDSFHTISRVWIGPNNEVTARHIELVVVVDGEIKLIGSLIPEVEDGCYRQLVIRQEPGFAETQVAQDAVAQMVAVLKVAQFDPFDLEPDLVGVELFGARLAGSITFESRDLEWDIAPTSVGRLEEVFVENLGVLANALGKAGSNDDAADGGEISPGPDLERSMKRTYNPVDGSRPPDCPFDDRHIAAGTIDSLGTQIRVEVERSQTHWSENDVANSSVSLTLRDQRGDESICLRAYASSGTECGALKLSRPTNAGIVEAVSKIVASLAHPD